MNYCFNLTIDLVKTTLRSLNIAVAIVFISCGEPTGYINKQEDNTKDSTTLVKQGEHLVTITGCNDCHSPKRMGPNGPEIIPEKILSGYPSDRPLPQFDTALAKRGITQMNEDLTAAAGPWGISFAPNLTSDATGAGSWPLENFKIALRRGKAKGIESGRTLLPPMPWFNYVNLTDEELEAIHAYLKSITPVHNISPEPFSF